MHAGVPVLASTYNVVPGVHVGSYRYSSIPVEVHVLQYCSNKYTCMHDAYEGRARDTSGSSYTRLELLPNHTDILSYILVIIIG